MSIVGSQNRFQAIDALRGIAALFVVWHHTSETFIQHLGVADQGTFLADIARDLDFGRIGIICFFLISGFVIPSSLKRNDSNGIKHFVIRRFFRLYPVYWLSIIFALVVAYTFNYPPTMTAIFANITMLQGFFDQPHLIGLYWTLQIELVFYFLCALLFYFKILHNNKILFGLIVFFMAIFIVMQTTPLITGKALTLHKEMQLLPYLLSIMFLGSFYRQIHDNKSKSQQNSTSLKRVTVISTIMCLGLPLFLLISAVFGLDFVHGSYRFGMGHSLGFVLFFAGLLLFKKAPKTLVWLGAISYSLYLFHPLVMKVMFHIIFTMQIFKSQHVSVYMVICTLISIFLAYIIYTVIEKPSIKKGQSLTNTQIPK